MWNYGVLAPGSYTLTVTNASGSGSAIFSINNPPSIEVTDPSSTSGDDYATTVLGNAWDMNSGSDIQLTGLDQPHRTCRSAAGSCTPPTRTTIQSSHCSTTRTTPCRLTRPGFDI